MKWTCSRCIVGWSHCHHGWHLCFCQQQPNLATGTDIFDAGSTHDHCCQQRILCIMHHPTPCKNTHTDTRRTSRNGCDLAPAVDAHQVRDPTPWFCSALQQLLSPTKALTLHHHHLRSAQRTHPTHLVAKHLVTVASKLLVSKETNVWENQQRTTSATSASKGIKCVITTTRDSPLIKEGNKAQIHTQGTHQMQHNNNECYSPTHVIYRITVISNGVDCRFKLQGRQPEIWRCWSTEASKLQY